MNPMFLAKRLGDITTDDIAEMIPFALIIMVAISIISIIIVKSKDAENDSKPIQEMMATIIDKQQVAATQVAITIWVIFEADDGTRVRVSCKASENYVVGDRGYLKWQGNRLISFSLGKTSEDIKREEKENSLEEIQRQYNMWTCPNCGAKNLQHWKRCADCGAKKVTVEVQAVRNTKANNLCPRCGRTQQQGDAFCAYCGQKLK